MFLFFFPALFIRISIKLILHAHTFLYMFMKFSFHFSCVMNVRTHKMPWSPDQPCDLGLRLETYPLHGKSPLSTRSVSNVTLSNNSVFDRRPTNCRSRIFRFRTPRDRCALPSSCRALRYIRIEINF